MVAFTQNRSILQTRMDQRGDDHMKMNFDFFQISEWMLETVRVEKVDGKMGSFVLFSCFLPELWSLNYLKKLLQFLQFSADFSKNSKSVNAIYILHLKVLITLFL